MALEYYGRVIDQYLQDGRLGPAAAMCRKVIRYAPEVVRTHGTLAIIAVALGDVQEAEQAIDRYVQVVKRTGTTGLAVPRLRLMASATKDELLIWRIADHLRELGDALGSERLIGQSLGATSDSPAELLEQADWWDRLLRAALTNADELWKFG
jgi:hypothetical protein